MLACACEMDLVVAVVLSSEIKNRNYKNSCKKLFMLLLAPLVRCLALTSALYENTGPPLRLYPSALVVLTVGNYVHIAYLNIHCTCVYICIYI